MGRNTARYTGPLRTIPPRCTRGTISKNGEGGIVPPFGEREVRGWPGAVCLLFSVLFLDLPESPDSMRSPWSHGPLLRCNARHLFGLNPAALLLRRSH